MLVLEPIFEADLPPEQYAFAGENVKQRMEQLELIEAWAREQGCAFMEINGQPGCEQFFPGWTKTNIILRKEL